MNHLRRHLVYYAPINNVLIKSLRLTYLCPSSSFLRHTANFNSNSISTYTANLNTEVIVVLSRYTNQSPRCHSNALRNTSVSTPTDDHLILQIRHVKNNATNYPTANTTGTITNTIILNIHTY
jgi:hypothetical protein